VSVRSVGAKVAESDEGVAIAPATLYELTMPTWTTVEPMRLFWPLGRRTGGRRRRVGVLGAASEVLGVPVTAVIPLQRHKPILILLTSLGELATLAILIATASLSAFMILSAMSLVLVIVSITNRHQILAFSDHGNVVLTASRKGWPRSVKGPVEGEMPLPEPVGLGRPVKVGGQTWWIDRSGFRLLRHARALLEANGEDDRGEGENDGDHDGDAVEVALDDRRSRRGRTEAATEHLRESPAAPAVQEDQHDERS